MLALKPDGSMLGMQANWLNHSPFRTYLIPGIMLAFFLGVLPSITFIGLIKKYNWRLAEFFNIYRNRHWSWSFSIYIGLIAVFWITIQLLLTQYFWIQPVIIFIGLFIIIFTLTPVIMNHFEFVAKK